MPVGTLAQAQAGLEQNGLAYAPVAVLAPGLAQLLALRNRLGVRSSAHTLAKLIDPFAGKGVRLLAVTHPYYLEKVREFLLAGSETAILMRGTEGEAYANPRRRPRIELYRTGEPQILFEQERVSEDEWAGPPQSVEARATASYVRRVLGAKEPVPRPIVNQLACCLFACGYASDFNQAKAMAAVSSTQLSLAKTVRAR